MLYSWTSIIASPNAAGRHAEVSTAHDMPYGRFLKGLPRHRSHWIPTRVKISIDLTANYAKAMGCAGVARPRRAPSAPYIKARAVDEMMTLFTRGFARLVIEHVFPTFIMKELGIFNAKLVPTFNSGSGTVLDSDPGHVFDSDSDPTFGFDPGLVLKYVPGCSVYVGRSLLVGHYRLTIIAMTGKPSKRLAQFCVANGVTDENDKNQRRRRAFTALTEDTMRVASSLVAPDSLDAVPYELDARPERAYEARLVVSTWDVPKHVAPAPSAANLAQSISYYTGAVATTPSFRTPQAAYEHYNSDESDDDYTFVKCSPMLMTERGRRKSKPRQHEARIVRTKGSGEEGGDTMSRGCDSTEAENEDANSSAPTRSGHRRRTTARDCLFAIKVNLSRRLRR
ncbi:hypothetical protein EVAR_61921_1 [Eumeta japonica]|uniref:Uncharacterized protein n=1 Tax=Eumeta variegata TaxID=151549 RepID=A0A4C1ZGS6_EUMVA|nr:hypothetical protein EVAR_61921_1 [Eumeta japonica]